MKLDALKSQSKLALWLDFRTGSLQDKSGNNNHANYVSGAVSFANGKYGKGLKVGPNGLIRVLDSASMRYTACTMIAFFESGSQKVNQRFLSHRTSTTRLDFYYSSNLIGTYNGSTTSSIATSPFSANMVGVKVDSVLTRPRAYMNGSFVGEMSAAIAMGTGTIDAYIGNFYTGASNQNHDGIIYGIVIINTTDVSDEDINQIYNEWYAAKGAGDPKATNFSFPVKEQTDATLVCHLDAAAKRSDNYYTDLSGNGNHGRSQGVLTERASPFGRFARFNGVRGLVGMGAMNAKTSLSLGTNDFTYGGWFNTGNLAQTYFLAGAYSSTPIIFMAITNAGAISYRLHDGTTNLESNYAAGLRANSIHHIVFSVSRALNSLYIYLDGALVSTVDISTITGSLTTANEFLLGANNSYAVPTNSNSTIGFKEFRLYNGKALSATEISRWYSEYAAKPVFNLRMEQVAPTLANVTSGKLSNTPFTVATGTWRVTQDANKKKWIESVVAGIAYMSSPNMYGTCVYRVYKGRDGNVLKVLFAANVIGDDSTAGQNAYGFLITSGERIGLLESTAGVSAYLNYTQTIITNNVDYYVFVTNRKSDGQKAIYAKGGTAFPRVTLCDVTGGTGTNPIIDNTTTTSKYACLALNPDDKAAYLGWYPGVLTVAQMEEVISKNP
jgi:hypothetical protein